ncbi:MAG TPA: SRPBCC family protein [Steroidobacteraceae bacterium]|nr:SRPBCC family protein [Steroidobacteraceae bacterium]
MTESLRDQFPRSVVCQGAVRIAASADRVWAMVGDVGDATIARSFIERIEMHGRGIGAVRDLHLGGGMVISERIEEYSDADRYYVYRVVDQGPTSFAHHLAMTQVVPAGPGQCIVSWITMAQPLNGCDAEVRAMLQGNIDAVLSLIKQHFER